MKETAVVGQESKEQYWRDFYEQNRSKVYAICMYYLRRREDAEDLVQQTFVRFFESFDTIRSSPVAFLKTIAANLAKDFLRKKKVRKEDLTEEAHKFSDDGPGKSGSFVGETAISVLKEVDEYCRRFIFYISQGLKLHQLANILKVSETKIRADSERCRRKALLTLCCAMEPKDFSEKEQRFIDCYFKKVYWTKAKVMKTMEISKDEFEKTHGEILKKISSYHSS